MLRWRLILGFAVTAALGGLCWLDHVIQPRGMFLGPAAVLVCLFATGEAVHLMRASGARPHTWAAFVGAALPVVAVAALPFLRLLTGTVDVDHPTNPYPLPTPATALGAAWLLGIFLCAVAAIRRFDGSAQCATDFAATTFVVSYVGGTTATLAVLRLIRSDGPRDQGLMLLIATVAIVKAGDIGAYAVGRLFGKHKLAPQLSPGKTWEGAWGAVAFSCLAAVALTTVTGDPSGPNLSAALDVVHWITWFLYAVALSVAGMVGDLAESLLKRSARVKDSSSWLPGFGGVLDMVDSLLLAAPVSVCFAVLGLISG